MNSLTKDIGLAFATVVLAAVVFTAICFIDDVLSLLMRLGGC